ncbi:hypothetical protein GOODEAATRI_003698 [Goodea atripinnis]|uniref:Uncharacterized protein n=1 Tax=Goodea atripinnis TaxID=208336 RepID=A0ABV0P164_9TELE
MHLRVFFDLWDAYVLQAVQSGQPHISDHVMFEVRNFSSHLQWVHLNRSLDVNKLKLDGPFSCWELELVRLQGAGLWLDIKESLLEASGLVLSANNQLNPHESGVRPMSDGEEQDSGVHMSRVELLQLRGKTQLWPLMEGLSVLNQLRLSTDLLHLALSPGYPCVFPVLI